MKPSNRKTVRSVVKFLVGASVAYTVASVVRSNTEKKDQHHIHNAEILLGGIVLSVMAAEQADRFVQRKFDNYDVVQMEQHAL